MIRYALRSFSPVLAVYAVLFTFVPAAPAPARAQGTVIKLATLVPEGSVWDVALREMGTEWAAATQGRVSLRVYPGGVAGDERDFVRKMRIGQLQAAAITTVGLASIDPAFQMFNIPMFFDSYPELDAVLNTMTPVLQQRLEAKGFILLNWGHGGWLYFFAKTPIHSVEDLKKTKMFAPAGDDEMITLWKANGFQPVPLASTDILTGIQTGMIDAYPITPLIGVTLQWYRQTPYMVGVGLAPLVGGMVVSKQAWMKISEADRAKILAACHKAEARLKFEVPRQDTTAITEMQKRGLTVVKVPAGEISQYRAMAQGFATSMRGTSVPTEILDAAAHSRDAYRKSRAAGH